ncbi:unnamed protein product [Prunus brigantina]
MAVGQIQEKEMQMNFTITNLFSLREISTNILSPQQLMEKMLLVCHTSAAESSWITAVLWIIFLICFGRYLSWF